MIDLTPLLLFLYVQPLPPSYQPPSPNSMCMATLESSEPVSQLALSADQLVLACVSQNSVAFFSLPDAAVAEDAKGPSQPPPIIRPVTQLTLDAAIKQFVWCKATEAGVQRYLVVTDDHKCHVRMGNFPRMVVCWTVSCGLPGSTCPTIVFRHLQSVVITSVPCVLIIFLTS
eukprot:1158414-Pelagomonas_calceolata.AAC.8